MDMVWEEEQDKSRRVVQCVVDGVVEGYYYVDSSDPGVYVAYTYNPRAGTYVSIGTYASEDKVKKVLKALCGPW